MFTHINGDLLKMTEDGKFNVILHGCNCFTVMGAGIARKIAMKYPEAEKADNATKHGSFNKLGIISMGVIHDNLTVINCYTQYYPGKHVDYEAIDLCFKKVAHYFNDVKFNIGMPLIGCGIAGGKWEIVKALAEKNFNDCKASVTAVEWSNKEEDKVHEKINLNENGSSN